MKIDFKITTLLDPNDGLPPSDLTPENAIIRVMLIKSGHVNENFRFTPFVRLSIFGLNFFIIVTKIERIQVLFKIKSFSQVYFSGETTYCCYDCDADD